MLPARIPDALRILLPVLGAASIILAWQFLLPLAGVPPYIAPTPTRIASAFANQWPLLLDNLWPTMAESLAGFLFGNLAAVILAVAFVYSRTLNSAYFPVVSIFQHDPDSGLVAHNHSDLRTRNAAEDRDRFRHLLFSDPREHGPGTELCGRERTRIVPGAFGDALGNILAAPPPPIHANAFFVAPNRIGHGSHRRHRRRVDRFGQRLGRAHHPSDVQLPDGATLRRDRAVLFNGDRSVSHGCFRGAAGGCLVIRIGLTGLAPSSRDARDSRLAPQRKKSAA